MALTYMFDTNAVSNMIRVPRGNVARRYLIVGPETVCLSIIVAAELRFGVEKAGPTRFTRRVIDVLARTPVMPFDPPADRFYAEIRWLLERQGSVIGPNDLFIAAHALALDLTLVTANEREFRRVPGLKVENWLEPAG